jgi:signal transduction histidine kinase/CheY-like chemotaxis protein
VPNHEYPRIILEASYRGRIVAVGVMLVAGANLLFAVLRLAHQLGSGLATPWWANALAAVSLAGLYLWFQRGPQQRAAVTLHVAAAVATLSVLVPVAYGYVSSIWWLTLIVAAMLMVARLSAAIFWFCLMVVVASLVTFWLQLHAGARLLPTEPMLETIASPLGFALTVVCLSLSFRLVVRRQAQLLRQQGIELAASNRAKDRFLRHVGHELRTPLHGILALTDQVLAHSHPEDCRRQLLSAHMASVVLLRHLDDLFDYAADPTRSISGLNCAPLSLRGTLQTVLDAVSDEAVGKGLRLCLKVDDDVLDQRSGDSVRLAQLALKLLANAVRFTQQGQIDIQLSVWAEQAGGVLLQVRDTGIGIADDVQPLIFSAFHRAEPFNADRSGGLGLGLAIAQRLAQLMGGRITVESQLGCGSCFRACLVIPELEVHRYDEASATAADLIDSIRILVCDDDAVCRILLSDGLEAAGHRVTVAEDGLHAWSIWQHEHYDLVLTDLEMPRMDGHELMRRIRARDLQRGQQRTPVVAVSAGTNLPAATTTSDAEGFDGFLRKPFLIGDALALLGRIHDPSSVHCESQRG